MRAFILITDSPNIRHVTKALLELADRAERFTHTICISEPHTPTSFHMEPVFSRMADCTRYIFEFDHLMIVAENRARFVDLFYPPVPPHRLRPRPLRPQRRWRQVRRTIRQPCWRAGRWKSLT